MLMRVFTAHVVVSVVLVLSLGAVRGTVGGAHSILTP